ncbi:hypothetical protein ACP70R_033625 [Stipagrostis hirtigluma subsp. patula]
MAPRRSARLALARGDGGAVGAVMKPRRSERLHARGQGGGGAEAAEMRPWRTARRVRARRGGGGEDRISALPADLLLQILLRLGCARAAARAGLVSRRWRGLWALLPEIHLRGVSPGSLDAALAGLEAARAGALAKAAPPAVLDVEASGVGISYRLVASWLLRAARLAPGELRLSVAGSRPPRAAPRAVQLPCFEHTNSIELTLQDFHFHLLPPQGGEFLKLERLALKGCHFEDAIAMLTCCPRLRVLEIVDPTKLAPSHTIHSATLEELVLEDKIYRGLQLDIVAPVLKHLSISSDIERASVSAPSLEKLSLNCTGDWQNIQLTDVGQLRELRLFGLLFNRSGRPLCFGDGVQSFMQQLPHLHLLRIELTPRRFYTDVLYTDEPPGWLRELPKTSILMLQLSTSGHEFSGTVLHVLKMVKGIEELTVLIDSPKLQETRSPVCYCHPYKARASEGLSLSLLKKVEFKGFTSAKSAINVLKLLLTSAKALEEMTVTLCSKDSPGYERQKQKLISIFNLYPTVKCQVLPF